MKRPITIMEKKLPISHSKMVERKRSTGPVKKNMPATPERPFAPPQPMRTMEKVDVEMTKLVGLF